MAKTLPVLIGFLLVTLAPVAAQDSLPELEVITAENAWALEPLLELESENCFVGNGSFSADGRFFATGGSHITQVWDIEKREVVFTSGDLCGDTTSTNPLFSPIEPLLAYESEEGTAILNLETSEIEQALEGGKTPLAFSADGTLLATLGDAVSPCPYDADYRPEYDSCFEVLIWEVASGDLLRVVPGYASLRASAAFSPDNQILFFSYHHEVLAWSVQTGELITVLNTLSHGYSTYALTDFVLDSLSSTLYVAGTSMGYRIFTAEISDEEITRGRNVGIYRREPTNVGTFPNSLEITADGTALIVGGERDGSLSIWDAHEYGRQNTGILLFYTQAHPNAVESLTMNPAGTLLASSDYRDRLIRLWGVRGGADARPTPTPTITPSPTVVPTALPRGDASMLPDLEPITVENADQVQTLVVLRSYEGSVYDVAFNPDGTLLATSGQDLSGVNHLILWDMTTQTIYWEKTFDYDIGELAFSPDGALLAVGGIEDAQTITLWDVATMEERIELYNDEANHLYRWIADIVFTPNGSKLVVTYLTTGGIAIWDITSGEIVMEYASFFPTPDGGGVYSATISRNGAITAYYEDPPFGDANLGIDNLREDGQLSRYSVSDLELNEIRDLIFTPDSHTLIIHGLTEEDENTVPVILWWDIENEAVIKITHHVRDRTYRLNLNREGSLLVIADNNIYLWDGMTGEELATLAGHTDRIRDLAFTQDGTLLASASQDGTVRLWGLSGSETMATPTSTP